MADYDWKWEESTAGRLTPTSSWGPPTPSISACKLDKASKNLSLADITNEQVKIICGASRTEFNIPKRFLVEKSKFFAKRCNIVDSDTGSIKPICLKDAADDFKIFLEWILDGTVTLHTTMEDIHNLKGHLPDDAECIKPWSFNHWDQLVHCFYLGAYLQAAEFVNKLVDMLLQFHRMLQEKYNKVFEAGRMFTGMIYKRTSSNSPIRRILVDSLISNANIDALMASMFSTAEHNYHGEFVQDLLSASMRLARSSTRAVPPYYKNACTYHEHPDMPEGYRCTD